VALLSRLEQRLPLLTGDGRDLSARQQTMRDAVAGSYDLLAPQEQVLFRRLGVFSGGFTLEATEAVTSMPEESDLDILDRVASLVNASLLQQTEDSEGKPRFRLLETIHESAAGPRTRASG
jgi:predicted ATPase